MGLLDIINGMQNGPRGPSTPSQEAGKGGMSPLTMAILALLAYKAVKHVTGGRAEAPASGGRAETPASGGGAAMSQASMPGGGGGGLGDILGSVLGGRSAGSSGGLNDLLKGGLGGALAGGAAGTVLSGGLNDLLRQLQDGGQKEAADSWVAPGPNKQIAPGDLANALGADQVSTMMETSGMSRNDLLDALSQTLPGVIDQMTPDGRVPSSEELRRLL